MTDRDLLKAALATYRHSAFWTTLNKARLVQLKRAVQNAKRWNDLMATGTGLLVSLAGASLYLIDRAYTLKDASANAMLAGMAGVGLAVLAGVLTSMFISVWRQTPRMNDLVYLLRPLNTSPHKVHLAEGMVSLESIQNYLNVIEGRGRMLLLGDFSQMEALADRERAKSEESKRAELEQAISGASPLDALPAGA